MSLGALPLICGVTTAVGLLLARMTAGILFLGSNTDSEKQVRAAAHSREWVWPSDMHKYAAGKARMKDAGVLGLALMQRLLRNFKSEYPLTVWCIVAHSISAVLIFLVASRYWSMGVGGLLFALYLTSFWPYQIILGGGYQGVAQMFLLISAFCFQRAEAGFLPGSFWYLAGGMAVGFMMFSSASGRKYIPLVVGAFLFSQRHQIALPGWMNDGAVASCAVLLLLGSSLGLLFILRFFYMRMITAIYYKRAPRCFNALIGNRDKFPLRYYLAARNRVIRLAAKGCLGVVALIVSSMFLSRSASFYGAEFLVAAGIGAVVLLLTFPDVIGNVKGYLSYWNIAALYGHFRIYRDYFAKRGKPIPEGMQGAGLPWLIRYSWRVIPFYVVAYAFSIVALLFSRAGGQPFCAKIGLVALSLSPILFGELTHSPQLGRAYFPGFAGLLLLMGAAAFEVTRGISPEGRAFFGSAMVCFVLLNAVWNLLVFSDDVWPARMASARLARALRALRVKTFYTYDTPYNDTFVKALPEGVCQQVDIRYISSLAEVTQGYVVIPETSAKSVNMETQPCAIQRGDFDTDPVLNRIIESKEISRCAVASFKTCGASRIWVHESVVTSYRDLILHEITEEDRWRGRGWILDASRLTAERMHQGPSAFDASRTVVPAGGAL